MARDLAIPPHSCNSPSYVNSLITGMVLQLFRIWSYRKVTEHWIKRVYSHSLDQGYQQQIVQPLLCKAATNKVNFITSNEDYCCQVKASRSNSESSVYFRLKFHPSNPQSHVIQDLWRQCILHPTGKANFSDLKNQDGKKIKVYKQVITYS